MVAESPYSLEESEWIRCYPGPAFVDESPQRFGDFAAGMLAVVTDRSATDPKTIGLVREMGPDSVLNVTIDRVRSMVKEIGDLYRRVPQVEWLQPQMPRASMEFLVSHHCLEWDRQSHLRGATLDHAVISTPVYDRRMRVAREAVTAFLQQKQKTWIGLMDDVFSPPEEGRLGTMQACVRLAGLQVVRRRGLSEELITDFGYRIARESTEIMFKTELMPAIEEIALAASAELFWDQHLREKVIPEATRAVGLDGIPQVWTSPESIRYWHDIMQQVRALAPDAVDGAKLRTGRSQELVENNPLKQVYEDIDTVIVQRMRTRLAEWAIEQAELSRIEQKNRRRSSST